MYVIGCSILKLLNMLIYYNKKNITVKIKIKIIFLTTIYKNNKIFRRYFQKINNFQGILKNKESQLENYLNLILLLF